MFIKDYKKFRKDVEDTIDSFFRLKPEQLKEEIINYHNKYDKYYDLDKISFRDVKPEFKEDIMAYRTMNYFYNVWEKLNELEDAITNIGGLDD